MLKISENNGTEEFGLVTPTPDNSLMVNGRHAIIWTNNDVAYWRIYGSLCFYEFVVQWYAPSIPLIKFTCSMQNGVDTWIT